MLIAEVCVNVTANSIDKNFTYRVPERLKFIAAGWRVMVPFKAQKVDGFVISVHEVDEATQFEFVLKDIGDVIDEEPWFTTEMLHEARWLAEFYLCPLSQAMGLFMPGRRGRKIVARFERVLTLAGDFDEVNFSDKPARLKLLRLLRERGTVPSTELSRHQIRRETAKILIDAGLIAEGKRRILRDSYAQVNSVAKDIELTPEQVNAIEEVKIFLTDRRFRGFLLHGVTSSGKTQVYIELAKLAVQIGRRVIMLVPEIALTGQAVENFKAHFADVAVIHSRLGIDERADTFERIRCGEVSVVIGARSALFTPIDNVGLIVVDEEQDTSYKQEKTPPYYHARVVAEEFARFHDAVVVFGSATPSLENFYRAKNGELTYLQMPRRVFDNPLPAVSCVDMRTELRNGNRSVLSRPLIDLLRKTVASGQQAIILLNRRGWSTVVMCRMCGHVVKCPDCGLPMTFHADGKLRCHHCDVQRESPKICPACGSDKIKFLGTGTEKLEYALKHFLPDAKILRMDRDSTGGKFGHRKILEAFAAHEYDILFGTQMVARGHDIPAVTAVGILNADSALSFSNFRAAEGCFELITQAAGRAGRADLPGTVIVQAYDVDSNAIRFGCRQDYEKFCAAELAQREEIFFPPFCRLVKLIVTGTDELKAKSRAKDIVRAFRAEVASHKNNRAEIFGPIPAAIAHFRGLFRFAVIIKSRDLNIVRIFLREHELHRSNDIAIDIDPLTTD